MATKGRKPNVGTTSYRSGLEVKVADQLDKLGIKAEYETLKIKYTVP